MPEVTIRRSYHPTKATSVFTTVLPGAAPITPERVRSALADTFSSPVGSYKVLCNTDGLNNVSISHPIPDSERIKEKTTLREKVTTLEGKVTTIEKKVTNLEEEKQQHNSVLLKFETSARLAQALNDYCYANYLDQWTADKIHESKLPYLPLLLSVWALNQHVKLGRELPECLSNLSADSDIYLTTRAALLNRTKHLSDAAESAWQAIPKSPGDLMIKCFLMGEFEARIVEAHPIPSVQFASQHFKDPATDLPKPLRDLALRLLLTASIKPNRQSADLRYVYEDTEGEREREETEGKWLTWHQILVDKGSDVEEAGSQDQEEAEGLIQSRSEFLSKVQVNYLCTEVESP